MLVSKLALSQRVSALLFREPPSSVRGLVSWGCKRQMKKWQCIVCGWIYDEEEGCEEEGIPPGTAWADIPEDFVCPECGVGKADFEMIEID